MADYTSQLLRRLDGRFQCDARQLDMRHGTLAYARQCADVASALMRRPYACVHLQYTPTTSGPAAPALLWLARLRRARVIISAHERPSTYERRLRRPLRFAFGMFERMLLRSAERALVFSKAHAQEIAARHRMYAAVVHMGIDAVDGQAANLSGGRDLPIVTFAGFIRPSKGVDVLVRAAPLAAARAGRPFRVRIVGATDPRDAAYVERLQRDIARANDARARDADSNVVEFVGEVPPDEYRQILASSYLFVFPFRTVSQSITFNEVMALGTPAIASDVGGVGEVIDEFGVGLTFKCDDAEDLARAIGRMLMDRELYAACRVRAQQYARLADWQNVAAVHEDTYREVLAA